MKTKKFNKRLVLNKSTVVNLTNSDMGAVKGRGESDDCVPTVDVTKCATNCNLETVRPSRCVC